MTPNISYRPPTPNDLKFITSSWLKSFRNSEFATFIPNELYYAKYGEVIESILKDRAKVCILCDPSDEEHIYGYVVFEDHEIFTVHYIYIKQPFRNLGLAKQALTNLNPNFTKSKMYLTHIDKIHFRVSKANPETSQYDENYPAEVKRASWFIKKRAEYKLVYNPFAIF